MHAVLVVEDEESIRWSFMIMLQSAGYTVFTVSSGIEAQRILATRDVDVVISDLLLAGGSGLNLLEWIKGHCDRTMAILITGQPTPQAAQCCCELDGFDFLTKPIRKDLLLHVVAQALEYRACLQQLHHGLLTREDSGTPHQGALRVFALQVASGIFHRELVNNLPENDMISYTDKKLARMFDSAPLAVAHVTRGNVRYVNPRFSELTGYRRDDIPTTEALLQHFYPDATLRSHTLFICRERSAAADTRDVEPLFFNTPVATNNGEVKSLDICGVFLPRRRSLYSFVEQCADASRV